MNLRWREEPPALRVACAEAICLHNHNMTKYLLLDANVVAALYLPHSNRSGLVRDRIRTIYEARISGGEDLFFYLPNFCVAEVFGVFMKHSFGSWNGHVKKTIDTRVYDRLVAQFQSDIHNANVIYHLELSRYHVLGVNLVAPIDHYFQFRRRRSGDKRQIAPMGTYDHMIISMGCQLTKIHGVGSVAIVSADDRLTEILSKCQSNIPKSTIKKLRLDKCQDIVGIPFRPDSFPSGINLKSCSDAQLRDFFGNWPLTVGKVPKYYRHVRA